MPWTCPRCGTVNSDLSMRCNCPPPVIGDSGTNPADAIANATDGFTCDRCRQTTTRLFSCTGLPNLCAHCLHMEYTRLMDTHEPPEAPTTPSEPPQPSSD